MGVILKWKLPETTEVSYDKTYIYRSTSRTGTYTQIAVQDFSDNTYFDTDGTASHWYKIRFYDSTNDAWSAYSEPMQAGEWKYYCTPTDVRKIANLTTNDISDSDLAEIISYAVAFLNHEINSKIVEEEVRSIDTTRENTIDGVNKTFYVQNSFKWPLGDLNDDGEVTTDDVIVYEYDSEGNKSQVTVDSIDANLGKIVLSSAPASGHKLTITYCYAPLSESEPHPMIRMATAYLAAALAYTKIEAKDFERISIGRLTVAKTESGFDKYFSVYQKYVHFIKSKIMRKVHDEESAWFGTGLTTKEVVR